MLSVYVLRGTSLERITVEPGAAAPEAAVWIDLVTPNGREYGIPGAAKNTGDDAWLFET